MHWKPHGSPPWVVHRNTVKGALEQLRPQPESQASCGSIIDPHRGFILAKLEQYPELTAAALFRQIGERGYTGAYTLVKECVADLRPRVRPAYFTLNFAPDECAQVDWGVWKCVDVPGGAVASRSSPWCCATAT